MPSDIPLRCKCGLVRGVAIHASAKTGQRVVCYCDDCQTYARFLKRPDALDASGGSDIFQMAAGRLTITQGLDEIRCVRLAENGLFRFYTECCRTPVANTIGARVPFAGVLHVFMDHDAADAAIGTPTEYIHGRYATGPIPPHTHPKIPFRLLARTLRMAFGWLRAGRSPLFDPQTKAPRVTPTVLRPDERAAFRASRP